MLHCGTRCRRALTGRAWGRILAAFALCLAAHVLLGADRVELPSSPSQRPRLKSIYSGAHGLEELQSGDTRALVLVFGGTQCPVARQYWPTLNKLQQEFAGRGVQWAAIFPDAGLNIFDMAQYAHDCDIAFPVLQDVDHRLADLLEAETTPEVVVLDGEWHKRYQGAIDDQFQRRGQKTAAARRHLALALESVLAGQPVERAYVPPSGCPLERGALARRLAQDATFHKDVQPILQQRCEACHRPGGPAPFTLRTFEDAAFNAAKIREAVIDRRMPPWHGVLNPEFGGLANDQRLSDAERQTLVDWIDADTPAGDPQDAPPPRKWPPAGEFAIGPPDYIYRMPEPFHVPKSGLLEYQFFRVPLRSEQDRWFQAVEIKPGNPEVVHHITLHVVPSTGKSFGGLSTMAQLYGFTGEAGHLINDFLPGDTYNAKVYPPGRAVRIPAHSDLVFEVHYTPNNRAPASDQSLVGFRWAEEPPQEEVLTKVFRAPIGRFRIPPRDPHFRMEDSYYFDEDVEIFAVRPHFHLRGKSYRLEIVDRDPRTDEIRTAKTLLATPIYDPAWQRTYELSRPLRLAAGTELRATAHFDNSAWNPNNPDPDTEVLWGQQTSDEMFSTRFQYRVLSQSAQEEGSR